MTTQQKNQKDLAPSHPSYPLIIRLGDDDHDAPESFPTSLQKILILQVFRHVTSTGYLASKSARIVAGLLAGPSGPSFVTNGLCQKHFWLTALWKNTIATVTAMSKNDRGAPTASKPACGPCGCPSPVPE